MVGMSNLPTTTENRRKAADRRQGDRRIVEILVADERRIGARRKGERRLV